MSTATRVPETWELDGDDARETLLDAAVGGCSRRVPAPARAPTASATRARLASSSRLVLVQGAIGLVGLASVVGEHGSGGVDRPTIEAGRPRDRRATCSPTRCSRRTRAAIVGQWVGARVRARRRARDRHDAHGSDGARRSTASTASSRTARRCRSTRRAFVLALTVGLLATLAFVALAFGRPIGDALGSDATSVVDACCAGRSALVLGRGRHGAAVQLVPEPAPAGMVVAGVRAAVSVVLVGARDARARRCSSSVSSRSARPTGRSPAIVALLLWALLSSIAIAVRRGGGGPARGRSRRPPGTEGPRTERRRRTCT